TNNSLFSTLVPELNSGFRLTMRQRLLSGFGLGPNTRFIRIARNNREISDIAFRNQVISTVSQIQNIYWDLVNAYEDVKVRERSRALAEKTLSDNRKQVEIGTLAPIEIVRAESEVATRNQELIVAQTNLQLQQLLMKNAITRDLSDPRLAAAPVIPTDSMQIPEQEPVAPVQDLIRDAFQHRPELSQARIDLTNRDINQKAARNAMLPTVDLVAWYGASGLAGDQNPNITCGNVNASPPPNCTPAPPAVGSIQRTGWPNAFRDLFDHSNPDYAIGFNVTIPLRNRAAQADQVRSELEYRQAQLRLRQLENQVGIEVRNAQFALQQNRARVDAATKGRQLAQESLDAEQKKYALGASTNFQVLQAQRDLTLAESNLVTARSAYEKTRVELDRVTGLTLARNNISMGDAESGMVETMPNIPGVAPRTETK
ncbi:MAG: TolC family protein, partial [Nevskiales bacterium]